MGYARWRAMAVAAAVAVVAGFGPATAARADVSIEPGEFVQGRAATLTFHVTNDGPTGSPIRRVEFHLPEDAPVAEVLPMTTAGWGSVGESRDLDRPIATQHGGTVQQVVAMVGFAAGQGGELPPGGSVDFRVAMLTLPENPTFTVAAVVMYVDGSTTGYTVLPGAQPNGAERPALTVTLTAPAAVDAEQPAATEDATEPADGQGTSNIVWLFGLLLLIGAITAVALFRQSRDNDGRAGPAGNVNEDDVEDEDVETTTTRRRSRDKASL